MNRQEKLIQARGAALEAVAAQANTINHEFLCIGAGGSAWRHHFIVIDAAENLDTQPAICGALPHISPQIQTLVAWWEPPSASVAIREMCPACLRAVAQYADRAAQGFSEFPA